MHTQQRWLRHLIVLVLLYCIVATFALPAFGDESQTATENKSATQTVSTTEPDKKLIDLSNPEEALNPDKYLELLELGKNWLLEHGPSIIIALVILIIGRWIAMWFAKIGRKAMTRGNIDETLARFLSKLIYYALLAAVVIAAADQVGITTTSFVAIFGAAGLAVGLALKDSLSNFASGVMLILFRPFKVGDAVTVGGVTGKVDQIDIFSTIILTPDNQRVIVPNSNITSDVITNITAEPTRRIDLVIGIGYDDDLREAKKILQEIVSADRRILSTPAPLIGVSELADSSVNLILRPWVATTDYWDVRLALIENIKLTFDERGISFPYPQQDVHMHQIT
ncbi:mechanosensitive ion channel family protein [Desulfogranum japonicum]|uniref:mechanosensitive ion channel family protein n=1 Tax=Desulfogranum japonicum TaxID=231447 RepID=UPI0003F89261|nr:mechanosensitive ion channel domain-containing protein [Desulfogranum japonicum]